MIRIFIDFNFFLMCWGKGLQNFKNLWRLMILWRILQQRSSIKNWLKVVWSTLLALASPSYSYMYRIVVWLYVCIFVSLTYMNDRFLIPPSFRSLFIPLRCLPPCNIAIFNNRRIESSALKAIIVAHKIRAKKLI